MLPFRYNMARPCHVNLRRHNMASPCHIFFLAKCGFMFLSATFMKISGQLTLKPRASTIFSEK